MKEKLGLSFGENRETHEKPGVLNRAKVSYAKETKYENPKIGTEWKEVTKLDLRVPKHQHQLCPSSVNTFDHGSSTGGQDPHSSRELAFSELMGGSLQQSCRNNFESL